MVGNRQARTSCGIGKNDFNNNDGLAKSLELPITIIPAQAGIQCFQGVLGSSLRWSDVALGFLRIQ